MLNGDRYMTNKRLELGHWKLNDNLISHRWKTKLALRKFLGFSENDASTVKSFCSMHILPYILHYAMVTLSVYHGMFWRHTCYVMTTDVIRTSW